MEEKFLLGFSLVPNLGGSKLRKIKNFFGSFEKAWGYNGLNEFLKTGLDEKISKAIIKTKGSVDLEKFYNTLLAEDIKLITEENSLYPRQLKEIRSNPYALFCKGNLELLSKKQIAIVGTRRPTDYGTQVTEKLVAELCQAGLTITSGLAHGIDSIAHQTSLDCHNPTIAVLGNGLDEATIKHSTNYHLARQLQNKNGLIVSEYPIGMHATKFTFPARNRIISGLSLGVLVVEAAAKSGSLITAQYALEQNREVFAVPGNIFFPQCVGSNTLIRQGAQLTRNSADILETLNFSTNLAKKEKQPDFNSEKEKQLYKLLSLEPLHVDKLAQKSNLSISEVHSLLSLMELEGYIKNTGAGMFIRL